MSETRNQQVMMKLLTELVAATVTIAEQTQRIADAMEVEIVTINEEWKPTNYRNDDDE